jgi:hypothetical protein
MLNTQFMFLYDKHMLKIKQIKSGLDHTTVKTPLPKGRSFLL